MWNKETGERLLHVILIKLRIYYNMLPLMFHMLIWPVKKIPALKFDKIVIGW